MFSGITNFLWGSPAPDRVPVCVLTSEEVGHLHVKTQEDFKAMELGYDTACSDEEMVHLPKPNSDGEEDWVVVKERTSGKERASVEKEGTSGKERASVEKEGTSGKERASVEKEGTSGKERASVEKEGTSGKERASGKKEGASGNKETPKRKNQVQIPMDLDRKALRSDWRSGNRLLKEVPGKSKSQSPNVLKLESKIKNLDQKSRNLETNIVSPMPMLFSTAAKKAVKTEDDVVMKMDLKSSVKNVKENMAVNQTVEEDEPKLAKVEQKMEEMNLSRTRVEQKRGRVESKLINGDAKRAKGEPKIVEAETNIVRTENEMVEEVDVKHQPMRVSVQPKLVTEELELIKAEPEIVPAKSLIVIETRPELMQTRSKRSLMPEVPSNERNSGILNGKLGQGEFEDGDTGFKVIRSRYRRWDSSDDEDDTEKLIREEKYREKYIHHSVRTKKILELNTKKNAKKGGKVKIDANNGNAEGNSDAKNQVFSNEAKGSATQSKGKPVQTNAKPVEIKPKSVEVKPKSVVIKSKSVEIKPKSVEIKPKSVEIKPKSVEIKPKSVAIKNKQMQIPQTKLTLGEKYDSLMNIKSDSDLHKTIHRRQRRTRVRSTLKEGLSPYPMSWLDLCDKPELAYDYFHPETANMFSSMDPEDELIASMVEEVLFMEEKNLEARNKIDKDETQSTSTGRNAFYRYSAFSKKNDDSIDQLLINERKLSGAKSVLRAKLEARKREAEREMEDTREQEAKIAAQQQKKEEEKLEKRLIRKAAHQVEHKRLSRNSIERSNAALHAMSTGNGRLRRSDRLQPRRTANNNRKCC